MTLPDSWPPRPSSGVRSVRVYVANVTTSDFADNAYMFAEVTGANPYTPLPYVRPGSREQVTIPPMPWGAGRNRNDANPDPAIGRIAPPPPAQIWCRAFIITTGSHAVEFSFDGETVQGWVAANSSVTYWDRYESGICLRGQGGTGTFVLEAW